MAKEAQGVILPPGVKKGVFRDNAEVVCFAMALILFFKTFVGQNFVIPSGSMRNTLMIGDHLLINKFLFAVPQWKWESSLFPMRAVERGDIVVFRYPLERDQDYVKRCVAKEGDRVEIREKRVYVNGKQVTGDWEHHIVDPKDGPTPGPWPQGREALTPDEKMEQQAWVNGDRPLWKYADPEIAAANQQGMQPYGLDGEAVPFRLNIPEFVVPKGQLLAIGDNRDQSMDSRYWGFVPVDHLRGRPFLVWWSYREGGKDDERAQVAENPGDVLMSFVDGARYFFVRTRWERTGHIPR